MLYRKIAVMTSLLLVILILYMIPKKDNELNIIQNLEYVYPNDLEAIYLLDKYENVSRATISVSNKDTISKVKDLLEGLTIDGRKKDKIPKNFKALLPKNTKILSISLKNNILKLSFSKEFNEVKLSDEEHLIESIIYTLTSLPDIDKIEIFVEENKLESLPNSKKKLPRYLDKNYGINKQYEVIKLNDIDSYTIYYVMNDDNEAYYTPVTKYVNNSNQDKVKLIIDELSSSISYQSNLVSYLDNNIKLLNYEILDKTIKLNFNNLILSNITNDLILEEVIYTIGLSLLDEIPVEKVIFMANNQKISTFSLKGIEK